MISFVEMTRGSWAPLRGSRVDVKEMTGVGKDMVKVDVRKNRQIGLSVDWSRNG